MSHVPEPLLGPDKIFHSKDFLALQRRLTEVWTPFRRSDQAYKSRLQILYRLRISRIPVVLSACQYYSLVQYKED